jgi:membrane fusion protein (multidrug efflux system)
MLPTSSRVALLCLPMAALLAACGDDAKGAPGGRGGPGGPGGPGGDRPVPVVTQVVQPREFSDSLRALGTVQAREAITVTAKVSELVQQVHFDSGDVVARGAPLVTLSGQQQQAALVEAQASAAEADRLLRRQSELAAQQLIARSALDTQRATRDAANARVAQIRAQLGERVIRAPFAGVLGIRQVSPGALVTPGTPIATLDDIARVYVDFPLPEGELAAVAGGQRIAGTSTSWPGRTFDGTVSVVDARVNADSRAVTVRGDFPNPDRALRPGMLVEVQVFRSPRRALMVPEIAVVQVGRQSFVWRVGEGGKVEQADVVIGTRQDGLAEITSGLAAGDRVVVDGVGKLRPGLTVQDAPPGATPAAPAPAAAPAGPPARS